MPTLAVAGHVLHYDVSDLTPPWQAATETILFHHGLGASSRIWVPWLPLLVERYRLVRFDMRGHGRSAPREPRAALSLDLLVEDMFAVADAAGVERFHLVGESIGGTIGLKAAMEQPARIRTLTVSNGAHIGGSIQSIDDWKQVMDAGGMAGWSQHMMPKRFFDGAISPEMWCWYEREQASASPHIVLEAVRLLAGADLSRGLETLRRPVLLLHGDSSPFIPVPVMVDLKSRLHEARLQVFAHARHGLPFSHGKECARVLRAFLADPENRWQSPRAKGASPAQP